MSPADLKVHLSTIGITGERESMMIQIEAGKARKTLAALLATVLVGAGLGLLGYSILGGGSPASADDPGRVHGRISEELEAKFNRSIPQRIVAGIRGDDRPQLKTPESKQLRLTVPGMKRVEGVPVYDAPRSGYDKALHDGVVHVRGTGFPWQRQANVYIAGHRVGYPGTKSSLVFWDLSTLENGDRVILTDANGTKYTYSVYKSFVVNPDA